MALVEKVAVPLELLVEIAVGVLGVVMSDDPLFDFGEFDEDGCVGNGGVSPADFMAVFLGGVLRFVDQQVAVLKKSDKAVIRG